MWEAEPPWRPRRAASVAAIRLCLSVCLEIVKTTRHSGNLIFHKSSQLEGREAVCAFLLSSSSRGPAMDCSAWRRVSAPSMSKASLPRCTRQAEHTAITRQAGFGLKETASRAKKIMRENCSVPQTSGRLPEGPPRTWLLQLWPVITGALASRGCNGSQNFQLKSRNA